MSAPLLVETAAGVTHLRLHRPDTGNALDLPMCHAMLDALEAVVADRGVRVILLSGEGRMFCAGGDLRAMAEADDRSAFVADLAQAAHRFVSVLYRLDRPVVAAVHGAVARAGLSLALLSDLVVADARTTFVTAYTSVGLTPDLGQSWLLPRAVGLGRALDLTLESQPFGATRAAELGIVSRVSEGDALAEARELADRIADGPAALGDARRLLRGSFDADAFDEHLATEARTIAHCAARDDAGGLIARRVARP